MPTIPNYGGPQVMPTNNPVTMQYRDFRGQVIDPKLDFKPLNKLALKFRDDQDDAIAQGAQNDMEKYITDLRDGAINPQTGEREGGWASLKGMNAVVPDGEGRGLSDRTREALSKKASDLASNMNPLAARKFMEKYAKGRIEDVYRETSNYVLNEDLNGRKQTFEEGVKLAINNISQSWANPAQQSIGFEMMKDSIHKQAQVMGVSPEVEEMMHKTATSQAHAQAIAGILEIAERNPNFSRDALNYLNEHQGDMLANDLLKCRELVNAANTKLDTLNIVDQGVQDLTKKQLYFGKNIGLSPDQASRSGLSTFELGILEQESGGRQFTNDAYATTLTDYHGGKLTIDQVRERSLTGKYADGTMPRPELRAYGASQISVAAAKDVVTKEWKQAWTEETEARMLADRDFNIRLGATYYSMLLKQFGGEKEKAIVAYNQGAGNVMQAVRKAETKEAREQGKTWLDFISDNAKKYLTGVLEKERKRTFGAKYDSSGKKLSIFDPSYNKQYPQYATMEESRKYVTDHFPLAAHNPEMREQTAQMLYNRIQQQKNDAAQEQQNGINDIKNTLIKSGFDVNAITLEQKRRVTPDAWQQLSEWAQKKRIGDRTGDLVLYGKYYKNENLLAQLTPEELDNLLDAIPEDKREAMVVKWSALNEKAQMSENQKALQKRAAQNGQFDKSFIVKKDSALDAIKLAVSPSEWKKISDDSKPWVIADFQAAAAEHFQILGKVPTELEVKDFARNYFGQVFDKASLNRANITVSDLKNRSFADARHVLTAIAKGINESNGVYREPTDDEVLSAFRQLDGLMFPKIDGVENAVLSTDRVNYVTKRFKEANGREPNKTELIKWYVRTILDGEEVPGEKTDFFSESSAVWQALDTPSEEHGF